MRGRFAFFAFVVVLGAFAACTSENLPPAGTAPGKVQPGSGTGSGGGSNEGGADSGGGGGDGGTCSNIMFGGHVVDALNVVGDPTPPGGGTIADRDYDLTVVNVYVGATGVGGPAGFSQQSTLNVTAGAFQRVTTTQDTTNNMTTTVNESGAVEAGDAGATNVVIAITCPSSNFLQYGYTAAGATLRLLNPITKTELTYTKR